MESGPGIPDTITITEYHYLDIKSNGADVDCSTSAYVGRESTPPVVKQVAQSLGEAGLKESALSVTNISHNNEAFGCVAFLCVAGGLMGAAALEGKGVAPQVYVPCLVGAAIVICLIIWFFGRRTHCSFRIRCADNESIDRVHILLAKFNRVSVSSTSWRYDVSSETLADWADQCIERANMRAARVAKSLGVKIAGVHSYEETHSLPQTHYSSSGALGAPAMSRVRAAAYEKTGGGASYIPEGEERSGARVCIQYRVANYSAPKGETVPA